MSSKTYLWIEDRKGKASYIFWETLMHEICPEVIVESKTNNRELVKAVKSLSDEYNRYIIAFDNVQIYMEQKILKQCADVRDNIFLLNLICFEYMLLEFDKPIVMDHFSTVHTSYVLNFKFTNNITILTGSSATGKTASFSFIKECMAVNPNIMCLNYLDYQKDIKKIISSEVGKLIVIDNADILLDDDTRKYISLDDNNQYLIIGRNPKNLFTTKENLFELVSEKNGEQTEFRIEPYL